MKTSRTKSGWCLVGQHRECKYPYCDCHECPCAETKEVEPQLALKLANQAKVAAQTDDDEEDS